MSTILQLNPPIPVNGPKGDGFALAWLDYGQEFHVLWAIAYDANGEIWWTPNPQVRMQSNWSMGRRKPNPSGYGAYKTESLSAMLGDGGDGDASP
jgi:hypothetical protein